MNLLRIILYPFGLVYGAIAGMRRLIYDTGILKRERGAIPCIVVGNITAGGTGKTPFVLWLAQTIPEENPVILSRGYGRNTKGFREVLTGSPAAETGDEPKEMQVLLGGAVRNFVCENRLAGIARIAELKPDSRLVIMDDGFQHLPLQPDAVVLLCDYSRPFFRDLPIPAGRLREFSYVARYASCIVVTKCPADMDMDTALKLQQKLARYGRPVFFAAYTNSKVVNAGGNAPDPGAALIAVSGLAQNKPFLEWAGKQFRITHTFSYRDHYSYTQKEVEQWTAAVKAQNAAGILTTGKDAVKIRELNPPFEVFESHTEPEILFDSEEDLIELLLRKID